QSAARRISVIGEPPVQNSFTARSREQRHSLFGPRTAETPKVMGKGEGTGLGLTICRQIVERHGGTIDLLNHEGRGTAFSLRLPRCVVPDALQSSKGMT
ncbi:MAG: ATP-binding protein, partial [Planctomycetota bacterium]